MHDFHPAIRPSGLYWVADVPRGGLEPAPDGRSATLRLERVPVIDQPRWPAPDAEARPAWMWITVTFTATAEPVRIDDPGRQLRLRGFRAEARAEARVEVPSLGFSWRSGPAASSSARFGVIGEESNGRFASG